MIRFMIDRLVGICSVGKRELLFPHGAPSADRPLYPDQPQGCHGFFGMVHGGGHMPLSGALHTSEASTREWRKGLVGVDVLDTCDLQS